MVDPQPAVVDPNRIISGAPLHRPKSKFLSFSLQNLAKFGVRPVMDTGSTRGGSNLLFV